MSPGKIAAQAGHAVQLILEQVQACIKYTPTGVARDEPWLNEWENGSYTKIALQVPDYETLDGIGDLVTADNFSTALVIDNGRTEIEPGTVTCMALQPMPRSIAKKYVGDLGLLK